MAALEVWELFNAAARASLRFLAFHIMAVFSWCLSSLLIGMVYLYRLTLQWVLGGRCRFEPSCSEYFIQAVRKYGPVYGAIKGLWRICRCQPLCRGGDDPP